MPEKYSFEQPYFIGDRLKDGITNAIKTEGGFTELSEYTSELMEQILDGNKINSTMIETGVLVQFDDGTETAPGIAFQADTDTGWYRIGSGNIGMTLNGTKHIDYSTSRIAFKNDLPLAWFDSGSTSRDIIKLDSSNNIIIQSVTASDDITLRDVNSRLLTCTSARVVVNPDEGGGLEFRVNGSSQTALFDVSSNRVKINIGNDDNVFVLKSESSDSAIGMDLINDDVAWNFQLNAADNLVFRDITNGRNVFTLSGGAEVIVNDDQGDIDFRVEGNSGSSLLHTNADGGRVGIAKDPGVSGATFHIASSAALAPFNIVELSAVPTEPISGDTYIDDGTNTGSGNAGWRRYTGSAWEDITAAAAATPGGSDTQIQYNNGGAFGGIDKFTWDDTDLTVVSGTVLNVTEINNNADFIHINASGGTATGNVRLSGNQFTIGRTGDNPLGTSLISIQNHTDVIGMTIRGATGQVAELLVLEAQTGVDAFSVEPSGQTRVGSNLIIGSGGAGVDYFVQIDGETNDGTFTWKEDEDYFEFADEILMATTEKIHFRDTAIFIHSSADGQLDIEADTKILITVPSLEAICSTGIDLDQCNLVSNWRAFGANEIQFRDSTSRIYSSATGILNLGVTGSLDIDTTNDVDIDASNGLLLDGANLASTWTVDTTNKIQFRDTGLFIHSDADGSLTVETDSTIKLNVSATTEATLSANDLTFNNGATDTGLAWATSGKLDLTVGGTIEMSVSGSGIDFQTNYADIDEIAVPTNPPTNTRRLFTDSASGELSVRTASGTTVSLEQSGGGGSSEWTDTGTTLHPTETGDEVVLGATSPVNSSKFSIDGDADQIQATIQGFSTQTTGLFLCEQSDGTDVFSIANTGVTIIGGNTTIGRGAAGVDYTLTFDGETNDWVATHMEDEDYLALSDDLLMNTTEKIFFRDTDIFIHSNADGEMTIEADTKVTIGVAGDVSLGDSTLRVMAPQTDARIDLGTASLQYRKGFFSDDILAKGSVEGELNAAFQVTTQFSTNINGTNIVIDWDQTAELNNGSAFTHSSGTNPSRITFNEAGIYLVTCSLSMSTSVVRSNIIMTIRKNGSTVLTGEGKSGYIRQAGQSHSSVHLTMVVSLAATDYLEVLSNLEGASGTVTLTSDESLFNAIKIAAA